jgi:hypothetical protein
VSDKVTLERAFAEASKLPASEQEAFAAWVLEELEGERRWSAAYVRSADTLARLAEQAMDEYRAGRTRKLDPDCL